MFGNISNWIAGAVKRGIEMGTGLAEVTGITNLMRSLGITKVAPEEAMRVAEEVRRGLEYTPYFPQLAPEMKIPREWHERTTIQYAEPFAYYVEYEYTETETQKTYGGVWTIVSPDAMSETEIEEILPDLIEDSLPPGTYEGKMAVVRALWRR